MTTGTPKILATMLIGVALLAGCGRPLVTAPGDGAAASEQPGSAAPTASSNDFAVTVTEATYGTLAATTRASSTCLAQLNVVYGQFGEKPPSLLPQLSSGTAGLVRWTYAAPRVPKSTATYTVTCHNEALTGTAFGSFEIAPAPLVATSFSARVTVDVPADAGANPDPSLTPLRDAVVAKMKATLATEWRGATRGLGGLTLVDQGADITISVAAARGTSVHRQSPKDGSEDIIVYVSDRLGPQSVENAVATALHELGHIWCCYGDGTYPPGTEQQGHWLVKERSPGLYGVDKYGLMTDPVTCETFGTLVSCPNRFSDREMTALGFAMFPPPLADPCISQALSLKSALDTMNAQLSTQKAQLGAQETTLTSLLDQIHAIEAQYPYGGAPPSVVDHYNSLVTQYNALLAQNKQAVASYNALVVQARTVASQLNALPCDAS